jgi:hypothetical protein
MGGSNQTRNRETATLRLVPRDLTHVTELQTGSSVRDNFAVCGKRSRCRAVLWQEAAFCAVDYAMSSWKGPSTLVTEQCRRHPVTEHRNKTVLLRCSLRDLFGGMSVFARRIKEMFGYGLNKCGRCAEHEHVTSTLLSPHTNLMVFRSRCTLFLTL